MELRPILDKLGHSLAEIRVRALQNITSKLQHGLLQESDLVQEKHLHIRLIEWFNYDSCSDEEQVLNLILRLAKHPSAATIYLQIEADTFLTKLRPRLDRKLQGIVDDILNQLYMMPVLDSPSRVHDANHIERQPSFISQNASPGESYTTQPTITTRDSPGYFPHSKQPDNQTDLLASEEHLSKLSTFPWISLMPTDRHVLSSTDNSLRSQDPEVIISACDFLNDVVFQDFPAEVFLQRPNIVKTLLSILTSSIPTVYSDDVLGATITCFNKLSSALQARVEYYLDPSLYTAKQEWNFGGAFVSPASTIVTANSGDDSRASITGHSDPRLAGDGQDKDNNSRSTSASHNSPMSPSPNFDTSNTSSPQDWTDTDDMTTHHVQMNLTEYSTWVMEKTLLLLENQVVVQSLKLLMNSFELLYTLLELLQMCMTSQKDDVHTIIILKPPLEQIGCLLEKYYPRSSVNNKSARILYCGIALYYIQFMQDFVSKEKVDSFIQGPLVEATSLLALDETLASTYPQGQRVLLQYLSDVDQHLFLRHEESTVLCKSCEKTCRFLQNDSQDVQEMISLAEESLPSLPYHLCFQFVDQYVTYYAKICHSSKTVNNRGREVLLSLLAHSNLNVEVASYKAILRIVKKSLSVENIASSTSLPVGEDLIFLVDRHVLYEICSFGLSNSGEQVSSLARDIVLYLLQGHMHLCGQVRSELNLILSTVMSILQSYVSLSSPLGRSIMCLFDGQNVETCLPRLERLRAIFRMLFMEDHRIREECLRMLATMVSEDDSGSLPADVSSLRDFFVTHRQRYIEGDPAGQSVFQVDGMMKVYNIYISVTVDKAVRRASSEQLALMLQDSSLHEVFLELGGLDTVLKTIENGMKQQNQIISCVPSGFAIMRHLLHNKADLRHNFAHDERLYYLFLKGASIFNSESSVKYDLGHLLTLLLFDEVASQENWIPETKKVPKGFSLPNIIAKRYMLPFKTLTHHIVSSYRCDVLPNPNPMDDAPYAERIRISWNIAWHGGIDALLDTAGRKQANEFSEKLLLTSSDLSLLSNTYIRYSLKTCLHDMTNATTHSHVTDALQALSVYIVAFVKCDSARLFFESQWQSALGRFFSIQPVSESDYILLTEILNVLYSAVSRCTNISKKDFQTLVDHICHSKGPVLGLILKSDASDNSDPVTSHRFLEKQLHRLLIELVNINVHVSDHVDVCLGGLAHGLVQRLHVADAPHFYNLASLEGTLETLIHLTARPGWSKGCPNINGKSFLEHVLNSLFEVLAAFHLGRGGMTWSYMGNGVTANAATCLQHLAHEMASMASVEEWTDAWLSDAIEGPKRLALLVPLWTQKEPKIRIAGLGIAVALTSTATGLVTMATHCQQLVGGIWGATLSMMLDHSECSLCRTQACMLMVNLTSQPMVTSGKGWQGPMVTNTETKVTLSGVPAMTALLEHCNFYQELIVLLSNYCPQHTLDPEMLKGRDPVVTPVTSQSTLTISGQENESSTTDVIEFYSVVCPDLVASVCSLLQNIITLAPDDTIENLKSEGLLKSLLSLVDVNFLQQQIKSETAHHKKALFLADLLLMYAQVLELTHNCCLQDKALRSSLLSDRHTLNSIVMLLSIPLPNTESYEFAAHALCWQESFSILSTLLHLEGNTGLLSIQSAMPRTFWKTIALSACSVLSVDSSTIALQQSCLECLALLYSEEGKQQQKQSSGQRSIIVQGADNSHNHESSKWDKLHGSTQSTSKLCTVLTKTYSDLCLKGFDLATVQHKIILADALKNLLALSSIATDIALKEGLGEVLVEHIKYIGVKLNQESLQVERKTKDNPLGLELKATFDLLRNFMYHNAKAKDLGCECGLSNVLQRLWPWCLMDNCLLHSMLHLLVTYTAHCPQASSSLAQPMTLTVPSTVVTRQAYTTNSLLHSVIKLASRDNNSVATSRPVFQLLSSLASSAECRGVIWKSNFLAAFATLEPAKTKKNKNHRLWLELLVNLSFHTDGQQVILNIKGVIDLLVEFGGSLHTQDCSILILKNLCHENKAKLLANEKLLPHLLKSLKNGSKESLRMIASSALCVLLHNSNKAKVCMKNANVLPWLQEFCSGNNEDIVTKNVHSVINVLCSENT